MPGDETLVGAAVVTVVPLVVVPFSSSQQFCNEMFRYCLFVELLYFVAIGGVETELHQASDV